MAEMERKTYSFPKERIKVLLLENIHAAAVGVFEQEGYQIETMARGLAAEELAEKIRDVSILGIRSATKVTAEALDAAPRLLAIGAYCIGTNQIDLKAAAGRGVAVFNAPFSNTRSVVELAVGDIIALSRQLTDKNTEVHEGKWVKSAVGSHELRGRTLGIVGYGNIGSQLSVLAENLGMRVVFYDIADKLALGNARRVESLEELLEVADIVTLHVDGRATNRGFFGKKQFGAMKQGALFLNLSRGSVVDEVALAEVVRSGRLGGAAVDVFNAEPKGGSEPLVSPLQGAPNTILTPHVAGSTEESQENIGVFVAGKQVSFVNTGSTALSVNLPNLMLPEQDQAHRLVLIHANVPGVLAKINTLLGDSGVNIVGQFLGTKDEIGYVITDIGADHPKDVIDKLRELPETIRLRVLY